MPGAEDVGDPVVHDVAERLRPRRERRRAGRADRRRADARSSASCRRGYDIHDERIEVILPLTIDPKTFPNSRGSHFLYLIGRLKDGVTPAQAQADLDTMIDAVARR